MTRILTFVLLSTSGCARFNGEDVSRYINSYTIEENCSLNYFYGEYGRNELYIFMDLIEFSDFDLTEDGLYLLTYKYNDTGAASLNATSGRNLSYCVDWVYEEKIIDNFHWVSGSVEQVYSKDCSSEWSNMQHGSYALKDIKFESNDGDDSFYVEKYETGIFEFEIPCSE